MSELFTDLLDDYQGSKAFYDACMKYGPYFGGVDVALKGMQEAKDKLNAYVEKIGGDTQ